MYDVIKQYLGRMLALELACKDGHYGVKGTDFRQLHELFDTILEDLSEMRDKVQEVVFLGRGLPAVSSTELLANVGEIKQVSGNQELLKNVNDILTDCLNLIVQIGETGKLTYGEDSMFSSQAEDLQQKQGFLRRSID